MADRPHLIDQLGGESNPARAVSRPQTAHLRSSPHAPEHSRKPHVDRSPQLRLRAVARSALGALGARRRLAVAEIDAAPPMSQIEADDAGNELSGPSPTRAPALRRSPPPPAHSCHMSRRRARLGSCARATARELRPSHAGLHSHYRAARQPAGDGSRCSAPPTSRDDNRWPRATTRERCAAHASHAMLGAARAPRQPGAPGRLPRR